MLSQGYIILTAILLLQNVSANSPAFIAAIAALIAADLSALAMIQWEE